jgi:hypothetical protein
MKLIILITGLVLAALNMSAQTISTFGDLRAKVLHVGQKMTGQNATNDQAAAMIVRELARNYQGRLSRQQFQELKDTIEGLRQQITVDTWKTVLNSAIETLQEKTDTLDIQQRILDYYQRVPQEHIYVHTDKPYYVPGDTVWFRAHLVDAVTHTPITRSRYVYVELHDQQPDTLVQRIIVKCDSDGVFANAIILPHELKGGCYTLAAYTQWMRNFPAERFCYKQILVVGSTSTSGSQSDAVGLPVRSRRTTSPKPSDSMLELGQRKGQLLIQLSKPTDVPLACVLYGSGNLIVADYTSGKVLRIDSQTLRPGSLSVAMVNRETGSIIAENQTFIEGKCSQVTISGKAQNNNDPMELDIHIADADGTPIKGNFSLSVTDYDVVKPDTLQPTIDQYLPQQPDDYPLANMLSGTYPSIDYSFQTSQTISGSISSTVFKKVKRPKLMLIHPNTGVRETFELGDSTRFTINGLDFPDGTTYVLEGMRKTGSTRLVQLNIDPMTFPVLHAPLTNSYSTYTIPDSFAKQAKEQVMYGSVDREIELPEVVKEKKRQRMENRLKIPPFKALYDDNPRLNNFNSMEILLNTLGLKVGRDDDNSYKISSWTLAGIGPLIYIDDVESNAEELMFLEPANLKSIEYFKHNDPRLLAYRWDGPTKGVLAVYLKPGFTGRRGKPLSMASIHQQGWKPNVEFCSPQYTDKSQKTRPDHRTTLYWNPKVKTDANGKARIRFYASDISKRYLVTLEGVTNNGTIFHQQQVVE